jgi:protein-tyrosine phosphatase
MDEFVAVCTPAGGESPAPTAGGTRVVLAKIFSVGVGDATKIGVMARPRGGDWLKDEIRAISDAGFSVVVSLLTDAEQIELDLVNEGLHCEQLGLNFVRLPIEDMRVPALDDQAIAFLATLRQLHAAGNSVVVHCRAGIGRSPMIAACIMLSPKCGIHSAFIQLSEARGMKVPETPEQREWALAYEKLLHARKKSP